MFVVTMRLGVRFCGEKRTGRSWVVNALFLKRLVFSFGAVLGQANLYWFQFLFSFYQINFLYK